MSNREALTMPALDDMDDFAPRAAAPIGQGGHTSVPQALPSTAADTRRAVDALSKFPSRETSADGQLNLKGPQRVLDRFKVMCKADRRAYYDMLEILMNAYEDA